MSADLVVIGAGPAGASAAIAAAGAGSNVVLADGAPAAGGQVWRAPASALSGLSLDRDHDFLAGEALRANLRASPVRYLPEHRVWSAVGGFRLDLLGPDGGVSCKASRVIVAAGAYERVVPFPGWTLPGVIGLAAATVLMKAQGMLPGRRVVVAGCGPLLAAVAAKIAAHGGEVAAVVDLASRGQWLKALRVFASQPKLLARGASWALKLLGRRIPVHFASTVLRAEGAERVERIVIGRVAEDGRRVGDAERVIDRIDALVVGHGLAPASELTRLLAAAHDYDRLRGGWTPVRDECGRTSVAGLYACGDGSGIRGALPAVAAGRLAGLAAAHDAGALSAATFAAETGPLRANLKGLEPFSRAAASLMALRPGMVADIAAGTVVCRCEDVTRREIEAAFDAGAADLSQLKHFTRCGMGPCQGRMCGDVVGELAAARLGSREAAGCWTARPPLFPVPLDELLGSYNYDDIPIPNPAPL